MPIQLYGDLYEYLNAILGKSISWRLLILDNYEFE